MLPNPIYLPDAHGPGKRTCSEVDSVPPDFMDTSWSVGQEACGIRMRLVNKFLVIHYDDIL